MDDQEQVSQDAGQQAPVGPVVTTPPAPPTVAQPQDQAAEAKLWMLQRSIKSGGSWFYWIAALSLVNTVVALCGGKVSFVIGLGATQLIDAFIAKFGGLVAMIGVPINLLIAAIYVLFGYFSCRRERWAFIVGIVFYSLDTLLFLIMWDVFALGFHVFALYGISRGFKADSALRQIEAQQQMYAPR